MSLNPMAPIIAAENLRIIQAHLAANSKKCGCIRLDKDMLKEIGVDKSELPGLILMTYLELLCERGYHVYTTDSYKLEYYIYKKIRPARSSEGCNQCPQNEDCCVESDDKPDFVMNCRHCTYEECRVLKKGNHRVC